MSKKESLVQRILKARVYDVAQETPLEPAARLSARLGNRVLLKREDLQPVFSFKLRGAYNKMVGLSPEARACGVIAASAGNHAQGVALSAQRLGCKAIIVMPQTTPRIKIEAVRSLGARVILQGDTYDEAQDQMQRLAEKKGYIVVHPYDDLEVIAGQGTIAVEILRQLPEPPDVVFIPIGGGGLIAGMATYIKELYPQTRIVGVEPDDAASMQRSLKAGRRVTLDHVGLFADGVAVKKVGAHTFRICRKWVDEVLLVDTDATCAAIKDIYEDTRSIMEPAGALAVAAAKQYVAREGVKDQTLVCIACGANMNFDRLRHVSERAEIGEAREALLAVSIPEVPGSFKRFCRVLGTHPISEFNYRYADPETAQVFLGVQVENRRETEGLISALNQAKFETLDLSGNELAKLHLRHMVGGHAPQVRHERVYRFEFPERPGALMKFLSAMPHLWNITLFHYRNHGTDYGRVLVGIQVPAKERSEFKRFIEQLGYAHSDESNNPAYKLFMG